MKRLPIKLARYFEYRRVRPKQEWRLALYRVNVGSASVDDLVGHDGIHLFTVNWLGMQKGGEANRDREKDNRKRGEAKSPRAMSRHTHHYANYSLRVLLLRES
jgi:hypothetical protein